MATILGQLDAFAHPALRNNMLTGNAMFTHIKLSAAVLLMALAPAHAAGASDLVEKSASATNLRIFTAALKTSGLEDRLKSGGPYTVFAPDDGAFSKLPPGSWDALSKDKVKLASVLSHHIIPGRMLVAEVKPGKTSTLQGEPLTLKSDNGKVTVDQANVIESDVAADNGVIHVIDTVVMP
jgi:uncharacterized surface protein with fasciclin (FAS1) repeats